MNTAELKAFTLDDGVDIDGELFEKGDIVRHRESGALFKVAADPYRCRIAATGEAAYAFRDMRGVLWVRTQADFEAMYERYGNSDADGVQLP